jgi:CheY-like chemotaxis protein
VLPQQKHRPERRCELEFLEDAGYVVETARNGADGLKKVGADGFAAIVLDIMMPVVNGWECLQVRGDELLAEQIPVAPRQSRAGRSAWQGSSARSSVRG